MSDVKCPRCGKSDYVEMVGAAYPEYGRTAAFRCYGGHDPYGYNFSDDSQVARDESAASRASSRAYAAEWAARKT